MKRIIMAVVATMCPVAVLSQQVSSIPEIIAFMSTNDYRRCFAITNEIDSVMASTTGILERATCKLLKVSILLDHSANMANEDSFVSATNLCREIESELSGVIAWQRIGALCKFANAMFEDGHPEFAFSASTNLLIAFQSTQCIEANTNAWNVLFRSGGLDVMPIVDFINANAAASQFRMDPSADLSPYTNALPQAVIREIIRRNE